MWILHFIFFWSHFRSPILIPQRKIVTNGKFCTFSYYEFEFKIHPNFHKIHIFKAPHFDGAQVLSILCQTSKCYREWMIFQFFFLHCGVENKWHSSGTYFQHNKLHSHKREKKTFGRLMNNFPDIKKKAL